MALASWNVVNDAFYNRFKENAGGRDKDSVATLANTFLIIGIASGALSAGPLARFGRWKGIMITNIFVFLGNGLSLIPTFFPEYFNVIYPARLVYGLAAGSFCVYCPKYINETAPIVVKGSFGAFTSVSFSIGRGAMYIIGASWTAVTPIDDMTNE